MDRLCASQRQDLDCLIAVAFDGPIHLPSVLLMGPPGTGKRTLACTAARELGIDFVEIPVSDAGRSVSDRLFGIPIEAERAAHDGVPPGELGRSSPTLLYLSGLQCLDTGFAQAFHRLVSTRRYVDAKGNLWILGEDLWIVGSLTYPARNYTISPEHWVCTAFQRRMSVRPPLSSTDLLEVCRSIIEELNGLQDIDPSVSRLFTALPQVQDNLHALRRWIETALYREGKNATLTDEILRQAMLEDVRWLLPKVQYRGHDLTLKEFQRWSDQFPPDLRPFAVHILREIAEYYYISTRKFYNALQMLINRSDIPLGSRVTFCKWQSLGAGRQDI